MVKTQQINHLSADTQTCQHHRCPFYLSVNGNQKCSDFGNSECSIFGIKTTVLLASAVQ